MEKIVFVCGIHGSGKGTVCEKVAEKYGYKHVVASEIINWKSINPVNKLVENIEDTQRRLIEGLMSFQGSGKLLLDGHCCLLNEFGKPERVPLITFETIHPSIIIALEANVSEVKNRLMQRDQTDYSSIALAEFQNEELTYAKEIAHHLGIACLQITEYNYEAVIKDAL